VHSRVKLSKRQIKEDKFTTFMLTSRAKVMDNWQYYALAVAAAIVVIVAVVYFVNARQATSAQAAAQFARATNEYRAGNNQVAMMSFQQIIANYGDTNEANRARFLLGRINYESRNYDEAIVQWQSFLTKERRDILGRSAAYAGIAAAHENKGDYAAAAANFELAVKEYPEGPLAGDYHLGIMRNHLLGNDFRNAQEQLDIIVDRWADTQLARRAQLLFAEHATPALTTTP
jgi:TolA-binding protein